MITNNQLVDAINHALLPCSLWCVMGGTRANYTRAHPRYLDRLQHCDTSRHEVLEVASSDYIGPLPPEVMSCLGPTAVPEEPAETQRGPCVAAKAAQSKPLLFAPGTCIERGGP
ncbi:predicted protein [Chaetomium globosum CBS 148.51]|uniref:Uncharacterized protein n=1 Tax=Chaetomium globosum (strain ATCC 6205 / CBS 148.51 / DSM 1962 / NBRC 6347 / NRRL 1970) TaxID=306901 RepID=Q2GSL7_CHAGB|nr:uncharacterized protein CHGG_09037 [Chaetomium globosum CBS 148.51]EAQ85023.1 predicted protein [Chaetomium globosum CBS 148.51]